MRTLLTLLVAGCLLALPTVAAAPSARVDLHGPTDPVAMGAGGTQVLLTVGLTLQEFTCFHETEFPVTLSVSPSPGIQTMLENGTVVFRVPAESFYAEPYRGVATVTLTMTGAAEGQVDVVAEFLPPADSCLSAGGFPVSGASITVHVGGSSGEAPTNETPEAPGNVTAPPTGAEPPATGNESVGNETPDNMTSPTATTPRGTVPVTNAPGAGYIGEYEAPEAAGGNSVPAPGALLVGGALLVAARVAGRRRHG